MKFLIGYSIGVILLLLLVALCGCEVLKHKSTNRVDSTSVKKSIAVDSSSLNAGSVKKEDKKSIEENEWWRIIQQFPRDTNVTNTNVYPSTVIYEGGKGKKEETQHTYDSAFLTQFATSVKTMFEQTLLRIEQLEKNKSSEFKGLGLLTMIAIALGVVVFFKGIGWLRNKYSIIKK